MDTPLATCEQCDPKGLYKKACAGEIKNFTGIDSEYEMPEIAEVTVNAQELKVEQCADKIIQYLQYSAMVAF